MTIRARLNGLESAEALLRQLPIEIRGKRLVTALRRASRLVAKRAEDLAPPPGYPGDKPDKLPLVSTLTARVKQYGEIFVAVAGTRWPEGAHGHLVEFGTRPHEIRRGASAWQHPGSQPNPFLQPAVDASAPELPRIIHKALEAAVRRFKK